MMGTSHAISGAAAWVAVTATAVPALGLYPLDPGAVILGALVCAGAALLPDADHHSATIAHSVPIAGRIAAGAIGVVSGGHRKGMHSLLAVLAVVYGMIYLGQLTWTPDGWSKPFQLGSAIAVAATITFAVKVLKLARSWPVSWLYGLTTGTAVGLLAPEHYAWLPWCIGTGFLVHLLGDTLTSGGVPYLWPITPKPPKLLRNVPLVNALWLPHGAFAVPVLGDTGSWREWALSGVLSLYVLWGVCATAAAGLRALVA